MEKVRYIIDPSEEWGYWYRAAHGYVDWIGGSCREGAESTLALTRDADARVGTIRGAVQRRSDPNPFETAASAPAQPPKTGASIAISDLRAKARVEAIVTWMRRKP